MPAKFIKSDLRAITASDDFGVDDDGSETGGVRWNGIKIPSAIFDDEHHEIQAGEGPAHIMAIPMIMGLEQDFPGLAANDPVTINGESYIVRNWKPDGTGYIEIFLDSSTES